MRFLLILPFLISVAYGQTLGGNAVFGFLAQPQTARVSALGGVNVSEISGDAGMGFQNPALLRDGMHQQAMASFNMFLAGIKNYSLLSAWHLENAGINLAGGIQYMDYGAITQTDASGNVLGSFRPVDYAVHLMASRNYHERFWFGVGMKYIHSGYGEYRSSGLALDAGVTYYDSANQLQVSVVAKNMGTQLSAYAGAPKEELPFDLQAGVTKRLANAPFQFSLTAHHLQRFNIYYNDTSFRASEGELGYGNASTLQKVTSHLVLSVRIFLHERLELLAGYNFQRRQDLNAYNLTSGLNGFTLGTTVNLKKLQVHYATGFYQRNMFHQFSLGFNWGSL